MAGGGRLWAVIGFVIMGNCGMLVDGRSGCWLWSLAFATVCLWAILGHYPRRSLWAGSHHHPSYGQLLLVIVHVVHGGKEKRSHVSLPNKYCL